jgi:hypothetical protein
MDALNHLDSFGDPVSQGEWVAYAKLSHKHAYLGTGEVVAVDRTKRAGIQVLDDTSGRRIWRVSTEVARCVGRG